MLEQKDNNPEDCFAVCIVKGSTGGDNIVGHVPREVHSSYGILLNIMEVLCVRLLGIGSEV